jgi:hypothetical protein
MLDSGLHVGLKDKKGFIPYWHVKKVLSNVE